MVIVFFVCMRMNMYMYCQNIMRESYYVRIPKPTHEKNGRGANKKGGALATAGIYMYMYI